MMEIAVYANRINKMIDMILKAVEMDIDVNIVGGADIMYDLAKELYYEFDANFEGYTDDLFDEILAENELLSVCILQHSDGVTRCYLQPVTDEDGDTYEDDCSDVVFIMEDVLDEVDVDVFGGVIVVLTEDSKDEDSEECKIETAVKDDEKDLSADVAVNLAMDFLTSMTEIDNDDLDSAMILVLNTIKEAYQTGFLDGASSAK